MLLMRGWCVPLLCPAQESRFPAGRALMPLMHGQRVVPFCPTCSPSLNEVSRWEGRAALVVWLDDHPHGVLCALLHS